MRRLTFTPLIMLLPILLEYRAKQTSIQDNVTEYCSNISTEDCYLCGSGIESLTTSGWGQNNIALISLNAFMNFPNDETLATSKAASFLCTDCLNEKYLDLQYKSNRKKRVDSKQGRA